MEGTTLHGVLIEDRGLGDSSPDAGQALTGSFDLTESRTRSPQPGE